VIVVITAGAEADLEQEATYVAEQSSNAALALIRELRQRCDSLAEAPRAYPLVPRYEHSGIRRRPFCRFLIFYRVGKDSIEVIHVLYGARDYEPLLFPES